MKREPKITQAELQKAQEDAFAAIDRIFIKPEVLQSRPPGGITAAEFAERYQSNVFTATDRLRAAVRTGQMKAVKVRMRSMVDGRSVVHNVYLPCK